MSEEPIRLHLGCGKRILDGFVNIDIVPLSDKVVKGDVRDLSEYADGTVEEIVACDLLEHFPIKEIMSVILKEWIRVLKPGGKMRVQCPDVELVCGMFYQQAQEGHISWAKFSEVVYGNQKDKWNFHHVIFHFDWLKDILEGFGMTEVTKGKRCNMCMNVTCIKK